MVKFRRILSRPPSSYVRIRREFEDSFYASVCKTQVCFPHWFEPPSVSKGASPRDAGEGEACNLLADFHGGGLRDYACTGGSGKRRPERCRAYGARGFFCYRSQP